jgi:hypothetical protein
MIEMIFSIYLYLEIANKKYIFAMYTSSNGSLPLLFKWGVEVLTRTFIYVLNSLNFKKVLIVKITYIKGMLMIDFKFDLCVSTKSFTHKPTRDECHSIRFERMSINMEGMQSLVCEGFAYTSVMKDNWRCGDNFICTHTVTYDIDHCDIDMREYIKRLEVKPTLAYTSSSNGVKGYGYRLIYLLESEICDMQMYKAFTKSFARDMGMTYVDPRSYKADQMWFGSKGCETFTSDTVLTVPTDLPTAGESDTVSECKTDVNHECKQKCNKLYNYTLNHYEVSCTFKQDFDSMTFQDFIAKYNEIFPNLEKTPIELTADVPIIQYPQDYFEIRRPWKHINGEVKKICDGEGRRRKLFINGIIRKKINPSISFENLLYNLVFEFEYYYLNNGNTITKWELWSIAENVMKSDTSAYDLGKPKYKSFVNPIYCATHNISKQQVWASARNKQQYIREFYDPSLSDKENIDVMKEHGLNVSLRTLKSWRKTNEITKYKKKKSQ